MKVDKYLEWKRRGLILNLLQITLIEKLKVGKINKKQYNEYKRKLDECWIKIWDYYPDKSLEVDKAFKKSFV